MPEPVPDDGAKDPIVRHTSDQCTEESVMGANSGHFSTSASRTSLQRSISEDPSRKYSHNTYIFHPRGGCEFDSIEEAKPSDNPRKTIETQTSRPYHPEQEKLIKCDDTEVKITDTDDSEDCKPKRTSSIRDKRCMQIIIATFIVLFVLLGAFAVTFFVLRSRDRSEPPKVGALQGRNNSSSEEESCPTFKAIVAKAALSQIKDSSSEFILPWRQITQSDQTISYVTHTDNNRFVIQKSSYYVINVHLHIDTRSWMKASDTNTYSANMCLYVERDDKPLDSRCTKIEVGTKNILPFALPTTRLELKENDVLEVLMVSVSKIEMISDGRLEFHPESC